MTAHDSSLPRRSVLAGGVLVAGGSALLTACGSSDTDAGATSSSSSSSSSTTSGAATPPGSASAGGTTISQLSAIPVGTAIAATLDGKPIIVAQPTEGTAVAFSAICTHQGCTVAPTGASLDCPCHGSKFDALTGKVTQGPASSPLPSVAVQVQGGAVVAGA